MEELWDESLFNDNEEKRSRNKNGGSSKGSGRKNKRKAESTTKVSCSPGSQTAHTICYDLS